MTAMKPHFNQYFDAFKKRKANGIKTGLVEVPSYYDYYWIVITYLNPCMKLGRVGRTQINL